MSQPSSPPDILTRELVRAFAELACHAIDRGAFAQLEALLAVVERSPLGQEAAHSIRVLAKLAQGEWAPAAQVAGQAALQMPSSAPLREMSQITQSIVDLQPLLLQELV